MSIRINTSGNPACPLVSPEAEVEAEAEAQPTIVD
jgi:hypothetical protein